VSFFLSVAALSAVYLLVAKLERTPALRFRLLPSPRPYLWTDLAWYGVAIAATAVSVYVFRPQLSKLEIAPLSDAVRRLPLVAKLTMSLVVFDFISFAVHLALHRSDALWSVHKVHHSTLSLDGLAAARTHMFENLLRFVPGQVVLFLIGVPASVVAPTVAIVAIYAVSNHSNLGPRFRWAEAVFVTPRLHRRHHVPATTQNNFGTIFTLWDRLLGTLVRRDTTADERFGVPGEIDSYPQAFRAAFRRPLIQLRQRRGERLATTTGTR
jgi:sterol desaturase/sphingolipid hydroxylase (fatty acid hydroxylase superfamily)